MIYTQASIDACTPARSVRKRERLMALLTGALLAALAIGASLTASAHPSNQVAEPASTAPLVSATSGCGRQVRTGVYDLTTTDGNNRTRKYLIHVPAGYNPSHPYSLNFVYHGAGGSSASSYSWGLQNAAGAEENGIFVYPDGIPFANWGVGWDDRTRGYDIPFFDNIVKHVETNFCVNRSRIFVAGFSWGGDFTLALICNRGNVIRAAAVNSASDEFGNGGDYMSYTDFPCATNTHPAVRFEHAAGGDAYYPAPHFATTSKLVQHLNSCSSSTTPVHSSSTAMACVSHNSCGREFVECTFSDSIGHNLPPHWAADTWAFFSSFQ